MNIFLDFDGPLIDNSLRLYSLYANILHSFNRKPLPLNSYWNLKRDCIKEEEILKRTGINDPNIIQQYLAKRLEDIELRQYLQLNKVVDGCVDALRFFKEHGRPILVTTRQNRENLFWELEQKNLSPYFSKILCGFDASLPASEVKIKMIFKEGCMDGAHGIIIGDTEAEILCGKRMHFFTIAISGGIRSRDYLISMNPDRIFDNIVQVVNEWNSILKEMKQS